MGRFTVDPGAVPSIKVMCGIFLDDTIGPLIVDDAERYAPHRTGELAESIHHEVDDNVLYILVDADYAMWVEFGHQVFHPSTGVTGPEFVAEEPFIRPAVYKYRSPEFLQPPAMFPVGVAHPGHSYSTLREYEEMDLGWDTLESGIGEAAPRSGVHYAPGQSGDVGD
jgi:hypothetical protein